MIYYGAKNLAESWRTVRKNTIRIAEDIPEDKYGFKAAPDTMSVAEMLVHLATGPHWAGQLHFVEKKDFWSQWRTSVGIVPKPLPWVRR